MAPELKLDVAVLGAGRMGAALAAQYATAGHRVRVTASSASASRDVRARVQAAAVGDCPAVSWSPSTDSACTGADVVVECLPEDVDVKHAELARAQAVAPRALLATSTSSLRVTDIGNELADPSRLAGVHCLNPPTLFEVLELVPGEHTSDAVLDEFDALLRGIGLVPIRLGRDTPGFVTNRLQFALLREAAALVDSGVVDAEGLDLLVSDGLAPRWAAAGPFATAALGGSELFQQLAHRLYPCLARDTVPPGSVVKREFPGTSIADLARQRTNRLRAILARLGGGPARTKRSV